MLRLFRGESKDKQPDDHSRGHVMQELLSLTHASSTMADSAGLLVADNLDRSLVRNRSQHWVAFGNQVVLRRAECMLQGEYPGSPV